MHYQIYRTYKIYETHTWRHNLTDSVKLWYFKKEKQIKWHSITSLDLSVSHFPDKGQFRRNFAESSQYRLKKISLWDDKIYLIKVGIRKEEIHCENIARAMWRFLWPFVLGLTSLSWGKTSGSLGKCVVIRDLKMLRDLETVFQPEYRKSGDYLGKPNERPQKNFRKWTMLYWWLRDVYWSAIAL